MVRKASAMGYTGAPARPHSAIGWLRRSLRGPIGVVADLTARMNLSVRAKILLSLCIVILIMSITNIMLVVQVLNYGRQYDAIIANITIANSISGHIKPDIDTEMWRIVAGKIEFTEGKQYDIINDVNTKLRQMMDNTDSPRARIKLEGILRTMLTLTYEVNRMGQQIAQRQHDGRKRGGPGKHPICFRRGRGGGPGLRAVRGAANQHAIPANARRVHALGGSLFCY